MIQRETIFLPSVKNAQFDREPDCEPEIELVVEGDEYKELK